ncbi:MAG: TonB family protein [Pedosphaera sp.]|nr:TonB family protein [Pedosphaera sp.]
MTATPQTCLITSVGLHAVAVLFFVVSTAFIPAPSPNLSSPVLEIVSDSVRLTDGLTAGGPETPPSNPTSGTPPPTPPSAPIPPLKQSTSAKTPPPQTEALPIEKKQPQKKEVEVASELKRVETVKTPKNAQDIDPNLPAQSTAKKPIQVAQKTVKSTKTESDANDALRRAEAKKATAKIERERAAEAAEAAESARQEAWNKNQRARTDALRGAAGSLSSTLSGKFQFSTPGKGGEAYAPYTSYLSSFYKLRWKKPTTLNVDRGEVGAEIVILRNGIVKSFRITDPSRIRALDDSVREVLDRNRQLRPLPDGTEDSERTISIRFDLSAAAAM